MVAQLAQERLPRRPSFERLECLEQPFETSHQEVEVRRRPEEWQRLDVLDTKRRTSLP